MQHPTPHEHARHDAILIAGHAAGDLTDTNRARADALLAACAACADLRRDLVAIAAATRSVPAPATLRRDLRLAPEQADRLRRGSWLRAFLRPFGAARSPFRPMATAFTSLGVVGLVVGVALSSGAGLAGGPAAGGVSQDRNAPGAAAATAGTEAEGNEPGLDSYVPMVQASGGAAAMGESTPPRQGATDDKGQEQASPTTFAFGAATRAAAAPEDGDFQSVAPAATPQPPNPLIAGSLALLGIGLLLFGLRVASRRVR